MLEYPGFVLPGWDKTHRHEMIISKKNIYYTNRSLETGSMPPKGATQGSTRFGQEAEGGGLGRGM